ncbi:MAG: hypothetical protein AB7O73_06500, partial [Bacteroidia bacterium]
TAFNSISKEFAVKWLRFGSKVIHQNDYNYKEKETDLGALFSNIKSSYEGQNIGALVLISDGIINKGADPQYLIKDFNFPVYTIGVGDTTKFIDAFVKRINHNRIAYKDNQFLVEVELGAIKLNGKKLKLQILLGNEKLFEKEIVVNNEDFHTSVPIILDAKKTGIVKYSAKISVLEGEKNIRNNNADFILEVIENKEKIALLSHAPHPDIAAIINSIGEFNNYSIKQMDYKTISDISNYQLYILHKPDYQDQALINTLINKKASMFIINPSIRLSIPLYTFAGNLNKYNETETSFNKEFSLFSCSNSLINYFQDLPAVTSSFGKYSLINNSQTLLNQKIGSISTNEPLLIFSDNNSHRTACFTSDGLWRWRVRDYQENKTFDNFNELINKSIQFLATKNDRSPFRIYYDKLVPENEMVQFSAEVYDKTYSPVQNSDVFLILKNENGEKFNYTFSNSGGYKLNAGYLAPGKYEFEANTSIDGKKHIKQGVLFVKEIEKEVSYLSANHHLLFNLSQKTNGKFYYLNKMDNMLDDINNNETIKPVTYAKTNTRDLINLEWIFYLILSLLCFEWFLRKYYGAL